MIEDLTLATETKKAIAIGAGALFFLHSTLFLVSLLPAINLRLSLYQTLGERFLYLPSVFSCLLIAYLLAILLRHTRLLLLAVILILAFYSVRLHQTNRSWREAAALSRGIKDDLVDKDPHVSTFRRNPKLHWSCAPSLAQMVPICFSLIREE